MQIDLNNPKILQVLIDNLEAALAAFKNVAGGLT